MPIDTKTALQAWLAELRAIHKKQALAVKAPTPTEVKTQVMLRSSAKTHSGRLAAPVI